MGRNLLLFLFGGKEGKKKKKKATCECTCNGELLEGKWNDESGVLLSLNLAF